MTAPHKQTPKALKAKAWKLMSKIVRMKYADREGFCECYTCGTKLRWECMDAGHGISGRGNFVLFLEEIIKPQCKMCNVFRSGEYEHFIPKLIDEYGKDQYLEWVRESRKPHKRTKKDYIELVHELESRYADLGKD